MRCQTILTAVLFSLADWVALSAGAIKVSGSTSAPALGHASGDPQLEALLRVKSAADSTGILREWTRANGFSGGYCKWKGVVCTQGTSSVQAINMWSGPGVQGLKGTLPPAAAFAGLSGLTRVTISEQPGITGTLHADWSHMVQLQYIELGNNSLTGNIPPSWSSLRKLKILYLGVNKLSRYIPASLGALTSLEILHLKDNMLLGTIPDLSRLSKLQALNLQNTGLVGPIPDSLKVLTSLQELTLGSNALTGTLPAWLGGLSQLQVINLQQNALSGSIPPSLGRLTQLRVLDIGSQVGGIDGTLPDALQALAALERLGLESLGLDSLGLAGIVKGLAGTVPRSWSGMKKLKYISLSGNAQLRGCLPPSWERQLAGLDLKIQVYMDTNIIGFC